jgi:hypothetical protein
MVKEEKKRQWGEERKETRAGRIRARDARTQHEENSEGGEKKMRRCQSRRQPRPVGHARGIRARRKGVAPALITAGGRAWATSHRAMQNGTAIRLGLGF